MIFDKVLGYPDSPRAFYARLWQGDLKRELGQWPQAEQIYGQLARDYAQHGEAWRAELALADCHFAQAKAPGDAHQENARQLYVKLQGQAGVSADVRVEAGCKLGALLAATGDKADKARAAETWHAVAAPFLVPGPRPALGPDGRDWLNRALDYLGTQLADEGRPEEARAVFGQIIQLGLPHAQEARDWLRQHGGTPPEK